MDGKGDLTLHGKGPSLHGHLATPESSSQDVSEDIMHCLGPRNGGDAGQRPTLLATSLSELASRFDTRNLMKVDSMLTQPCQYLEGASVFSVNEEASSKQMNAQESEGENQEEIMQMEASDMTDIPARESDDVEDNGAGSSSEGQGGKMDILDTAPYLMSEDGVVFQCFPVFEKEVFIVSLEDEALLMNEALPENIPVTPEIVLEENTDLELLDSCGEDSLKQISLNVEENPEDESQSLMITENTGTEESTEVKPEQQEQNNEKEECGYALSVSSDVHPQHLVQTEKADSPLIISNSTKIPEENDHHLPTDKLRKRNDSVNVSTNKPAISKVKASAVESDEPLLSEWFRCYICSVILPSAATLRHHLVKQHAEKTIESYQCFLCEHECWSASQQEWHLRVQHGVKNKALACPVCGYQLSTAAECRAHIRKHPPTLACPTCPLKFAAHHQLVAHAKDHLALIHPYKCLVCGVRFTCSSTLRLHSWRHSLQKCPKEECDQLAEDESWLMLHLQRQHSFSTNDVREILTERDAADHKMDSLLEKYLELESRKTVVPSEEWLKSSNRSMSLSGSLKSPSPLNSKADSSSEKQSDEKDFDVARSIMDSIIGAVVSTEEEEGKKQRDKDNALQKVIEKGPSLHRCGLCNMYLSSAEELTTHKMGHSQVIECDKCQKKFQSVKQLKRHLIIHKTQEQTVSAENNATKVPPHYSCLECGKMCRSESALSRHQGIHSRNQGHQQCQICKRRVRTRAHLTEHMARVHKINHESKKIQCPMCDRKFTTKVHLDSHLISHGEVEPLWSCDKCGRSYIRHRSLLRHMATHDQEYVCQTCNEKFISAQRLAVHARSHDPKHKTRHACPRCPQKYAYESQLQVHMRIHTGEKPYVCEICGKCFKRLQQCKAHHRMIHSNTKMACLECGKMFGDKANLLRHRLMVHYHLKRWVCGACGQSYAYSQDLWTHLQKTHNLPFERLDNASKKSLHEIYVIPELGTHKLSPAAQATVEAVCIEERQKVRQVLSGTCPNILRKPHKATAETGDNSDDPDNPKAILETPVAIRPMFVPSTNLGMTVDNTGQVQPVEKTVQNVMTVVDDTQGLLQVRVVNVKCVECGGEGLAPLQCGVCGATACGQPHMDLHVASAHRVVFQCSVCGLHYSSQADCVAHVTSAHSSHLLAIQGGNTTYLPPQPMQPLQVANPAPPPQLCMPLASAQSGPHCLVQVAGGAGQMPLVIAPASVPPQQVGPNNIILQYPTMNNSIPSNVPVMLQSSASVAPMSNQGKQPLQSLASVPNHIPIAPKQRLRKLEPELKEEKQMCAISMPTNNASSLLLPTENGSLVSLSGGPSAASLSTLLPQQDNGEGSTFLMNNANIASQEEGNTPLLLVGSLPFTDASNGTCVDISQSKPGTLSNPSNTSMASVLLTLAEAPQHDTTSSGLIMTGGAANANSGEAVSHTPSITMEEGHLSHNGEPLGEPGPQLVPMSLPAQGVDGMSQEQGVLHQVSQTEDEQRPNLPQEVSVEIIQPNTRRAKVEKSSAKKRSRTKRGASETDSFGMNVSYICDICHKNFTSAVRLEKHKLKHNQSFSCEVCSKTFTEKYNLKTHMLTHTQDRPHLCNLCPKSFRYMRDLTEHKRTHEGKRPHVCDTCNKGFVRQRELARHVREQHGTQRHLCKICGAAFKRRMYLETVHMRSHHPQTVRAPEEKREASAEKKQNHICRICGRSFAQARYLTSHLKTHSKRAEYVRCPRCPRMFTSELTLKVHKQAFHDKDMNTHQDQVPMEVENKGEKPLTISNLIQSDQDGNAEVSHVINANQGFPTTEMQHPQLLHSATLDPGEQSGYCDSSMRARDVLESEPRSDVMVQFTVQMDDCDPIRYLTPFSPE